MVEVYKDQLKIYRNIHSQHESIRLTCHHSASLLSFPDIKIGFQGEAPKENAHHQRHHGAKDVAKQEFLGPFRHLVRRGDTFCDTFRDTEPSHPKMPGSSRPKAPFQVSNLRQGLKNS